MVPVSLIASPHFTHLSGDTLKFGVRRMKKSVLENFTQDNSAFSVYKQKGKIGLLFETKYCLL